MHLHTLEKGAAQDYSALASFAKMSLGLCCLVLALVAALLQAQTQLSLKSYTQAQLLHDNLSRQHWRVSEHVLMRLDKHRQPY